MKTMNVKTIFNEIWKSKGYDKIRKAQKEFDKILASMNYEQQLNLLFNDKQTADIADKIAKMINVNGCNDEYGSYDQGK